MGGGGGGGIFLSLFPYHDVSVTVPHCNLIKKHCYSSLLAGDTEISFDIDEIITDIEQIDEGWWRGVRELDGSYGLFPANYVELI